MESVNSFQIRIRKYLSRFQYLDHEKEELVLIAVQEFTRQRDLDWKNKDVWRKKPPIKIPTDAEQVAAEFCVTRITARRWLREIECLKYKNEYVVNSLTMEKLCKTFNLVRGRRAYPKNNYPNRKRRRKLDLFKTLR